ncbi:MAG: DUF502 domain-containing protein [Candidatus Eisenbacteria bacterium]|uniref:DUF502 domain-containing protein n=1 Tax=Eiseniibacteriota bacterium TaxID=2212470 RepID=A0A933SFX1_UNCEI|nr:DUF502 domain-containing protein [Candidatus Eisenbacteria bacterium]
MTPSRPKGPVGPLGRLRNYLLTGLLVLAPTAVTLFVFYRLLNWVDNLLGRYLRFEALDYHRIPGLGLLATLTLLVIVGFLASLAGQGPIARLWDKALTRIPGVGLVYGSTKSLGEAFLTQKEEQAFRKVVLVQWPQPNMWRIGFVTGHVSDDIKKRLGADVACVFIPHTPNPASGFVHYAPKADLIYLDWSVEEGLKVVVSGGVVQPGVPVPVESSDA